MTVHLKPSNLKNRKKPQNDCSRFARRFQIQSPQLLPHIFDTGLVVCHDKATIRNCIFFLFLEPWMYTVKITAERPQMLESACQLSHCKTRAMPSFCEINFCSHMHAKPAFAHRLQTAKMALFLHCSAK